MDFTPEILKKYRKYTTTKLHGMAVNRFNKYIRERDRDGDYFYCPTCNKWKKITGRTYQACHCFPAGLYPELEFNENNVFGGCLQCNYFKHGTNYIYNDWVRNKIGEEEYQKLLDIKAYWAGKTFKEDRFYYIEIIEKYNRKSKELM